MDQLCLRRLCCFEFATAIHSTTAMEDWHVLLLTERWLGREFHLSSIFVALSFRGENTSTQLKRRGEISSWFVLAMSHWISSRPYDG